MPMKLPVGVNPIDAALTTLVRNITSKAEGPHQDVHAVIVLSRTKEPQLYVNGEGGCQKLQEISDPDANYPPLKGVRIERIDYVSAMPYAAPAAAASCWYQVNGRLYHCK